MPEIEKDGYEYKYNYANLDPNIIYQQGQNVDQYTIYFNNRTRKEQAVVNIRFSPKYFEELIEFEVNMNEIHLSETNVGKDVIVNWRFLNGFNNNGKFYTDSNALTMQERKYNYRESWNFPERETSTDRQKFNIS